MASELITEYKRCVAALEEAERDLKSDNPKNASALESMLSSGSPAMRMLQRHHSYGPRLQEVVGKMKEYKERKPLVAAVADAEMISGNWAQCIAGCMAKSLEVATVGQIAELRIKHGKDSAYCTNGSWVAENFNYLLDGRILVASREYNPHFRYAEEATNAHIAGKEFYLDDKIVEGLLEGVKQGSVLLLKRTDVANEISTDSFGKEPLTAFLGWNKDYAQFLNSCGIKTVGLFVAGEVYAKKQKQAFSRALWACDLGYGYSALGGDGSLNLSGGRVSGVSRGER